MKNTIVSFKHTNGNSVRLIENTEQPFTNRYHVQSKGPNTVWVTNRIYRASTKYAHYKKFHEICRAVEHVTIVPIKYK